MGDVLRQPEEKLCLGCPVNPPTPLRPFGEQNRKSNPKMSQGGTVKVAARCSGRKEHTSKVMHGCGWWGKAISLSSGVKEKSHSF